MPFGWLSRIAALCLLLLALSPCTAPFVTFDFDHGPPAATTCDAWKVKPPQQEALIGGAAAQTPLVWRAALARDVAAPADTRRSIHQLYTVLRI